MGGTNTATKSNGGVKIVDLGNELRVDPRQIVAAAKEMAMENAKVPASWVSAGQADRLRAKFGGQGELKAKIERKLRHFESALETPIDAPKPDAGVKTHSPKLGKRTFEVDRRAIFGVVRNEVPEPVKPAVNPSASAAAGAVSDSTLSAAPVSTSETPSQPAALPPVKKFIGVQVAPPIRRELGTPDPRFGVTVPSPENEKKDTGSAIWKNLNDGFAPVDFSTPGPDAKKAVEEPVEEIVEPRPKVTRHSGRTAAVQPEPVVAAPVAPPAHAPARPHATEESTRRHQMDVPVKWQPKNKAYGSKVKHKTKLLKKLETREAIPTASAKKSAEKSHAHDRQHEAKRHSTASEAKAPESKRHSERNSAQPREKSDGVLKRLIRKIFK